MYSLLEFDWLESLAKTILWTEYEFSCDWLHGFHGKSIQWQFQMYLQKRIRNFVVRLHSNLCSKWLCHYRLCNSYFDQILTCPHVWPISEALRNHVLCCSKNSTKQKNILDFWQLKMYWWILALKFKDIHFSNSKFTFPPKVGFLGPFQTLFDPPHTKIPWLDTAAPTPGP